MSINSKSTLNEWLGETRDQGRWPGSSGAPSNVNRATRLRAAQLAAGLPRCRGMASRIDYGTALREVQTRAEALGLGFRGATPRAMLDCLKSSLPVLAQRCDAFRRPGQKRAHAHVLAQCEELLVAVA